jgi:hypothetical protein
MTTVRDLITLALKDSGVVGVGQTANAEDMTDNLRRLNIMLAQWARKRWLVWNLTATSIVSTGAQSYTVGAGGDFNIPRVDKLEDAYFRLLNPAGQNQLDYPLEIIEARQDYDQIAMKSLVSWPSYCFYDSAFPLGRVYFSPIPAAALYQLFIVTKTVITALTSLSQELNMPPEYEGAVQYNLAARMRPAYQLPPDPAVTALATDSLNVLRTANAQVPRLQMPGGLGRTARYNIYSDR